MTTQELYGLVSEHLTEMLESKMNYTPNENIDTLLDEVITEFLSNLAL